MNLIKSKTNSLAWLTSAIYFSVVGGVILSSTPALAATFTYRYEDETSVRLVIDQDTFGKGNSPLLYRGNYWQGTIDITESNGESRDDMVIRVYLQHIHDPHPGDGNRGELLNLDFRSVSSSADLFEFDSDSSSHPGIRHSDLASGILTVNKFRSSNTTGIRDWNLALRADHNVPEPGTILSAAVALGWGGWLKRKNLIKQDKTKS